MAMSLIAFSGFGQEEYEIKMCKDALTDKYDVWGSKKLVCLNSEGSRGFSISPVFVYENEKVKYKYLTVTHAGLGSCSENDSIIFLFEDGSKVSMKSWNKFNCKGLAAFDLKSDKLDEIAKPLKVIRVSSGRSYKEYTHTVKEEDKSFLLHIKNLLDEQNVTVTDCES